MAAVQSTPSTTLAANTISLRIGRSGSTSRQNLTAGTFIMAFKDAQSLLSPKPLTRPKRTRPVG